VWNINYTKTWKKYKNKKTNETRLKYPKLRKDTIFGPIFVYIKKMFLTKATYYEKFSLPENW